MEEEPAEEEAMEEEEMAEADLDGAFTTFLADMEAYNTIRIDALNEMMVESPPFF
jgi:hypothetical protein